MSVKAQSLSIAVNREEAETVGQTLSSWRDQKFGILLHWGLYSVPGICESWPLTSEDWITPDPKLSYEDYKKWYWGLKELFNPTQFDPTQWARVAREAGMRYAIFTTKHHDGFCLWNTRQTDFSVMHTPFATDPKADIARHVFDAFRAEGFMTGAYFSKPDWHHQDYWWDKRSTHDRYHNYPISQFPDKWERYKTFVHNQIAELTTDYGRIDILWLDGGWCTRPREDIDLATAIRDARQRQPGMLVVERGCPGEFEDYQTPEQRIPETQLNTPWESCITLTDDWGWVPKPRFKSPITIVNTLCEIVAKGGSLLLGVGPTPQGLIEDEAVGRLREIGAWLRTNGEAIYGTSTTAIYSNSEHNVWFTSAKDSTKRYAIVTASDTTALPHVVRWQGNVPARGTKLEVVGSGKKLAWTLNEKGEVCVSLPPSVSKKASDDKVQGAMPIVLRFTPDTTPLYRNPNLPIDLRVSDLLRRMTLREKVGQLLCPLGWPMYERTASRLCLSPSFKQRMNDMPMGSLWATLRADPWTQKTIETGLQPIESAEVVNKLQHYAVDSTRLGIPLLIAEEAAHGHMALGTTVFPTGLSQASTGDSLLMREMGQAIAEELRMQGVNVAYGPILDLARDPRWSRVEETLGEDPQLVGSMGAAMVRGMKGVVPTLKHFCAYGQPQGGINGAGASMGPNELRQHTAPFRQAIEAGAGQVMASYNAIDGIPCSANADLLTTLLRNEWGFRGVVTSDLHSIEGIATNHGYASSKAEASAMAIKAGVDIDLEGNAYGRYLIDLVEHGQLDVAVVDTAVARVLRQKFSLGLFENPYVTIDKDWQKKWMAMRNRHHDLARRVATEGTVLLSNDGILPLGNDLRTIAVLGPNADNVYNQLGDYTAPQRREDVTTVLDGIRKAYPQTEVLYNRGCAVRDTSSSTIDEAVGLAKRSEVTILVVGGSSARDFKTTYLDTGAARVDGQSISDMDCGEGYDRSTLNLLGHQQRLMERLIEAGVPLVVIYIQGRPLDMNLAAQKANALLTAWYPGEAGGEAIADLLTGKKPFTGRLPITIPRHVGQLPLYNTLSPAHDYTDGPSSPLYPFGYKWKTQDTE